MGLERKVKCDVEGCGNFVIARTPNEGYPRWGCVQGIQNDETGAEGAWVCPDHLNRIKAMLNGGDI